MKTKDITLTALFAAILAVTAPLSIQISTQVPISMATLIVMLTGAILGAKRGTIAVAVYILLGAVGFPVFAQWTSGIGILFGVTGGFIFGYIPLVLTVGLMYEKKRTGRSLIAGMITGNFLLYMLGTVYFMIYTSLSFKQALAACVIPFLPGDAAKMVIVYLLAPRIMQRLRTGA